MPSARSGRRAPPSRAEPDDAKRALWQARSMLLDALDGRGLHTNLTAEVLAVFEQKPIDAAIEAGEGPEAYVRARADRAAMLELEFGNALKEKLKGFNLALYKTVDEITRQWDP